METKKLLNRLKTELRQMKGAPKTMAGYFAKGGTLSEWELRSVGGYKAAAEAVGFVVEDAVKVKVKVEPGSTAELSIKLRQAREEIARLRTLQAETEKMAASDGALRELILGTDRDYEPDMDWLKGARKKTGAGSRGIPCLILSDNHVDEFVDGEAMNGMNHYDRPIAIARIKQVFKGFVELYKHRIASPQWDGCVLNLLGDLVSGTIHDELEITNEYVINETILTLEEVLIEGITGLADEFGKVYIPCIVGNHGRQNKKPRAKNYAKENYEWLIYMHLMRHFQKDGRVSIEVSTATDHLYRLYDRWYLAQHGQEFKGGSGIGGIMIPIMRGLAKKQSALAGVNRTFHVALMGHFHQYIHTSQLVINGSTKGYDEWTKSMGFSFEKPQQAAWVEHPEHGMVLRTPIFCE